MAVCASPLRYSATRSTRGLRRELRKRREYSTCTCHLQCNAKNVRNINVLSWYVCHIRTGKTSIAS